MTSKSKQITTLRVSRLDHALTHLKHEYRLPANFASVLFGDNIEVKFQIEKSVVVDVIDVEYQNRQKSILEIDIKQITINKETEHERSAHFATLRFSYDHKIHPTETILKIGPMIDKEIARIFFQRLDPTQKPRRKSRKAPKELLRE